MKIINDNDSSQCSGTETVYLWLTVASAGNAVALRQCTCDWRECNVWTNVSEAELPGV